MKNPKNTSWKELDANWKEKLHQQSELPQNDIWVQINQQLNTPIVTKEKKKKILFLSYWSWAAIFALAIGLFWIKIIQTNDTKIERTAQFKGKEKRRVIEERREKREERKVIVARREKREERNVIVARREKREERNVIVAGREKREERKVFEESRETQNLPIDFERIKTEEKIAAETKKMVQDNEIWVKINIDPIHKNTITENIVSVNEKPEQAKKKKLFVNFIKQIKNILDGENPSKDNPSHFHEGIHQVANTYYKTEEKLKQTFQ
jgi:hypothetical protein